MKERTEAQKRKEALFLNRKNGYDLFDKAEESQLEAYSKSYRAFLDAGKTERECVDYIAQKAQENGFHAFECGEALKAGDKVYRINRGKAIMLAVIGSEGLDCGANIGAAHIDAPRLDLKQYPLYEEKELAYLKTHYYGGIRKYHWVSLPLELHGVMMLADGTERKIRIGGESGDPVFTINDLLPHLAADQAKKPLGDAITAEQLNLLVGSRPFPDDEGSDRVKLAVLELLHEKYGIIEEDFLSAELVAVPALPSYDVGFDRSMIGAYGQDDRVCAYACLAALFEESVPKKTAVCMLADKEEIGSEGVTGMKSAAFDVFMSDLCETQAVPLKRCYEKSFCLSADVTAAFDPNFAEVYEKQNSAYLNYGLCISKYTGSRGKSGASDASAELISFVRGLFTEKKVVWQTAELGKTDQGGGGTVAAYMASRNIDTLDAGVPVLSMHAPFETVAKLDCYMMYKAMAAIYGA